MAPKSKRTLTVLGLSSVALFLSNAIPVSASDKSPDIANAVAEDAHSAEIEFGDIQHTISQTINTTKSRFGQDSFDFWQTGEFETTTINIRTVNSQVVTAFEDLAQTLDLSLNIIPTEPLSAVAIDVLESSELAAVSQQPEVVGTSFDVVTGRIILDVDETLKEQATVKSARIADHSLSSLQSGATVAEIRKIPIIINHVGQTSDSANVRGDSAMAACTTGFSATIGTTKGFISADHCGPTMQFWNTPTATGKALGTSTRTHSSNRQKADIAF